jgi:diguanylate cyclase (GGDEF)-like protein
MAAEKMPESVIGKVSHELSALEKRDLELYLIVAGTGIIVSAGLLLLLFPAAVFKGGSVHFEITVSRELFAGLVAMLALLNIYVATRRMQLRKIREALISTTVQSELTRLQSFTDPLTEVYNRRSLDDMSAKYIRRAIRLGKPLTFLLVDADHFKEINTRFGHLTGDFVIAEIASLLWSAVRGSDAVIRFGGDEFLIILADTDLQGSEVVAGRIAKSVEDWNHGGHLQGFELSLSLGAAEWTPECTLDSALDKADQNMYSTKDRNKKAISKE